MELQPCKSTLEVIIIYIHAWYPESQKPMFRVVTALLTVAALSQEEMAAFVPYALAGKRRLEQEKALYAPPETER